MFNPQQFRQQFPYFQQKDAAVYLDNAATTLKPQALIDASVEFYQSAGSVHRSQYDEKQTALYEQARQRVQQLINAESERAIIWTSGTTQSINMVANGLMPQIQAGDEIIISMADHHANFVTWQQIAQKCGAKLHILPLQADLLIDSQALTAHLNARTKLVALNFVSNVTGVQQPVAQLIKLVRQHSQALILVDAAQAISHFAIDLQQLDADFLAFSAHKIYGPTGLGVLAGKLSALQLLQPLQYGGKMVESVQPQQSHFAPLPYILEAGTPNIAAVIGFESVLAWLQQWDFAAAEQHARDLAQQAKVRLKNYPNCRIFDGGQDNCTISFVFEDFNCADLATLLAEQNIALRTGVHCAMPYLQALGQAATLRLSFAPYNNQQDVEDFFHALQQSIQLLSE